MNPVFLSSIKRARARGEFSRSEGTLYPPYNYGAVLRMPLKRGERHTEDFYHVCVLLRSVIARQTRSVACINRLLLQCRLISTDIFIVKPAADTRARARKTVWLGKKVGKSIFSRVTPARRAC